MNRETIAPKDEAEWLSLRTEDITSTEISALFGLSPYTTEFELWHRKKDKVVVEFEDNERMVWGRRLEDAIAYGLSVDEEIKTRKMTEYMRIPELNAGASFDYSIEGDNPGLLEIKNVDSLQYKYGWEVDEEKNVEAPPHIELQVQHQLLVSGRSYAKIGALIGGNTVVVLEREADIEIQNQIKEKLRAFWTSIYDNKEPKPDFEKDSKFIAHLYGHAEPGKVADATESAELTELAIVHQSLGAEIKELTTKREAAKAQMLILIQDAEKVKGAGFTISAGLVGPTHVEYERKGYRNFRVNWPRAKKGK